MFNLISPKVTLPLPRPPFQKSWIRHCLCMGQYLGYCSTWNVENKSALEFWYLLCLSDVIHYLNIELVFSGTLSEGFILLGLAYNQLINGNRRLHR